MELVIAEQIMFPHPSLVLVRTINKYDEYKEYTSHYYLVFYNIWTVYSANRTHLSGAEDNDDYHDDQHC